MLTTVHPVSSVSTETMRWSVDGYGIVNLRNSIWLRRVSGPNLTKMEIGDGAFCHFMTGADANMAYVMRVS